MPHLEPDVGSDKGGAGGGEVVGAVGRGIKPPSSSSESDMVDGYDKMRCRTVCM